jgi:methylmalonyl-CoA epimerase
VTLVPGAGDDVQALKAGVMEIADVFVVNKADLPGADAVAANLQATIALAEPSPELPTPRWTVPVLRVTATSGEGVSALVELLERFRHTAEAEERRRLRAAHGMGRHLAGRDRTPAPELDHVGIATGDGPAMAALFSDILGLPVGPFADVSTHRVRVTFVETGAARIEIVAPLDDDSPITGFLERRGGGLHHIALRVTDLDATLSRLKARNVRLIDEQPRMGAHGGRVAFLHPSSTHGVLIELVERDATG